MQHPDRRSDPCRSRNVRPAAARRPAGAALVVAACLAVAAPAVAQVADAPPRHVPGPVSPGSGKAISTPTTSPIPGASTTGNATGPDGAGPAGRQAGSPAASPAPATGQSGGAAGH